MDLIDGWYKCGYKDLNAMDGLVIINNLNERHRKKEKIEGSTQQGHIPWFH